MKQKITLLLVACLLGFAISVNATDQNSNLAADKSKKTSGFVEAKGQDKAFADLRFQWKHDNVSVYFLQDKLVFLTQEITHKDNETSLADLARGDANLAKKHSAITQATRFDLVFENCNAAAFVGGENRTQTKNDFYLGHCPEGILNVSSFNQIRYKDLYPGIDLVFSLNGDELKYEFQVKSGANPNDITLRWDGVNGLHLTENKQTHFSVGTFDFTDAAPVSTCDGKNVVTEVNLQNNHIKFNVGEYNTNETLIIDPALVWASSLEYNGYGSWGELVTNSTGKFYIVDWEWNPGATDMQNYFNAAGTSSLYSSDASNFDIVISQFSRTGDLLWVCRYGSTREDDIMGAVTLDDNDNLYIAGETFSQGDFPLLVLAGAYNQAYNATCTGTRGYLLKFNSANARQWATYIDNGANFEPFDIACGMNNDIYIAGKSGGSLTCTGITIPTGSGYLGNYTSNSAAHNFVLRFNSSGALSWSTWLPGATNSTGRVSDITVSKTNGDVFLAGDEIWGATYNFAAALITAALSYQGQSDLFYLKFDASNNAVPSYGKYLGGAGFDKINVGAANGDIELDASGNLYACGHTYSANFPLVNPGTCAYYDGIINDGTGIVGNVAPTQDGYLFKVNASGTLSLSTFFGGTAYTSMKKIKNDSHGNMWICSEQSSTGLPVVNHADYYNQTFAGTNTNLMFSQLTSNDYMAWLTYFGYGGYMGFSGFDIYEPTADSINLDVCGNFNTFSNTGGGYQWATAATCTGAASFRQYLSSSAPFTISGPASICAGASATFTTTSGGGTWSSSNTSVATINSSTGALSGVSGGTTTISYSLTVTGCVFTVSATLNVTSASVAPSSITPSSASICSGATVTLTANGGSLGAGANYNWYSGSCGGTLISSGSSNTLSVSPTSTTTYYINASGTCNTTTCASTTITVNTASTAPTSASANNSTICSGASTTLSVSGGSLGTGASWNWYTGGCGTTLAGTGSTLVVSPTSTTTYYVLAAGTCNTTTCVSTTVTVNSTSTAPTSASANNSTICSGASTTLSVSGGSLGTGASWNWYTGGCGTTLAGTGSTLVVSPTSTTTYYVLAAGTCNTTTCVSTTVTVNSASTAPTSASANNSTICSGASTTLSVSGGSLGTGASWNWYTGGCGTTLAGTGSTLVVSPTSTTTYYVLAAGTCNTTTCVSTTVTVNTNSSAPTSISASANPICSGQTSTLSVNGGSLGTGATWEWYSGGCGTTAAGSGSSINVNPTTATTYYVLASGSCNTTTCASLLLDVTTVNASAGTNQTICTGATTTLTATGGGTYLWSAGSQTTASIVVTPAITTTYTVTVSVGSCSETSSVVVNVTSAANASITPAGPFCTADAPINLSAVDPGGTWTGTGITNTSNGTFGPGTAGVGTFQIIYTISGSCGDADTINIQVVQTADAAINAAGPFCSNDPPVNLTAATAGGAWSGSGITNASLGTFSPSSVGAGTYQIIYTISGTCGDADTISIVVNTAANATITAAGPFCIADNPVTLTAATAGGTWSGTGITNASTGTFDPGTAGVGTHTIIYTISGVCGDADTISISVVNQLDATITSAGPFCTGNTAVNLTAATSGGVWTGTGITSTSLGTFNPQVAGAGIHSVIYTISGACGSSDTAYITVNASPIVVAIGTGESCQNADDGTVITNITGGLSPYTYIWNVASSAGATLTNATPGIYNVTVTDGYGCSSVDSALVSASTTACEPIEQDIFVPNIFSPNGDLINDVLYVYGKGVKELKLIIYDRWGEKVFETTELTKGWDGTFKGKAMDPAVFAYYLQATFANDEKVEKKGNITLVR